MFELKIDTSNAAFEADAGAEIARILREVADLIVDTGNWDATIQDVNGNTVGRFAFTD